MFLKRRYFILGFFLSACVMNQGYSSSLLHDQDRVLYFKDSLMDSVQQGSKTRAFKRILCSPPQTHLFSERIQMSPSTSLPKTPESQFYSALQSIFGGDEILLRSENLQMIIQSAKGSYPDARELIEIACGEKFDMAIEKGEPYILNKLLSRFQTVLRQELKPSIEELQTSLVSAWSDLNDYTKSHKKEERDSCLSTLECYIRNGGDIESKDFRKVMARVCYEFPDIIPPILKTTFGLSAIPDLKNWGLKSLEDLAAEDAEVNSYLETHGE